MVDLKTPADNKIWIEHSLYLEENNEYDHIYIPVDLLSNFSIDTTRTCPKIMFLERNKIFEDATYRKMSLNKPV